MIQFRPSSLLLLQPLELIAAISNIRGGGAHKIISELLRNILIVHERRAYDGFRLTTAGYDFLALRSLLQRGAISEVGRKIGVGKESDIFVVRNADETEFALKLHRLGRRSFRNIVKVRLRTTSALVAMYPRWFIGPQKRDYLKHRRSAGWLYMSKLAAVKEYAFMKVRRRLAGQVCRVCVPTSPPTAGDAAAGAVRCRVPHAHPDRLQPARGGHVPRARDGPGERARGARPQVRAELWRVEAPALSLLLLLRALAGRSSTPASARSPG